MIALRSCGLNRGVVKPRRAKGPVNQALVQGRTMKGKDQPKKRIGMDTFCFLVALR